MDGIGKGGRRQGLVTFLALLCWGLLGMFALGSIVSWGWGAFLDLIFDFWETTLFS